MTRQRGITVEVLDYTKLAAACALHNLAEPSYGGNAILRRPSDGAAVVLSYEGVGATKIAPGVMYLDTQWSEWQCLPVAVVEACRTGEEQDLADFIRTFGDRLNVNHYRWYEWATS